MHREQANEPSHDASLLPNTAWSRNFRHKKIRGILMKWKDKEVEKFKVERQNNKQCPILLKTPAMDYGLSVEDFKKVKQRILEFDIE